MQLKLACADFTFPLLAHDAVLDLIAMLGFHGVDIGLFEGRSHLWPSRVFKNLKQSARELTAKLGDRGLKAADIFLQTATDFVSLAPNHPDARRRRKARDLFLRSARFRRRLRQPARVGPAGRSIRRRAALRVAGPRQRRVGLARRAGGRPGAGLWHRSPRRLDRPRPKDALTLVQKTPGLTLTLDYTHFTRMGIADEQIEPLVPHASHFHARGARKGRLQSSFNEQHDRLRPRLAGHAQVRLSRLRRHRIRVDRLGALQRGRQSLGNDPVARLFSIAKRACKPPASQIMRA